jgi:predicted nucleic acid-binding protein
MATLRAYGEISDDTPRIYVDTSAALSLYEHEQATSAVRGYSKRPEVPQFFQAGRRVGCEFVMSPLVLEEAYNVFRKRFERGSGTSFKALLDRDATAAREAHAQIHGMAVQVAAVAWKHHITVAHPVPSEEDAFAFGRKIKDSYLKAIRAYPSLDGMDALHLVFGTLLACSAFVSNDPDFRPVNGITVYLPRIPK